MNEGAAIYTTSIAPVSGAIAAADENSQKTASPIKHLLVLIDENRASDNVHSTYVPTSGQKVWNRLSTGSSTPVAGRVRRKSRQVRVPGNPATAKLEQEAREPPAPSRESVWRNLLGRFGVFSVNR